VARVVVVVGAEGGCQWGGGGEVGGEKEVALWGGERKD